MKSTLIGAGVLSLLALTTTAACSDTAASTTPATQSTQPVASAPAASSAPVGIPAPAPTPTPSARPTPLAPIKDAQLKRLLLTAKDLGKPWRAANGAKGALPTNAYTCSRSFGKIKATSRRYQGYYQGKTGGAAIELAAVASADSRAARSAFAADLKKCHKFSYKYGTQKYYTTDTADGPRTVVGADEVIGSRVRRYFVVVQGQPHITSVARVLVVRKGRLLIDVGYSDYREVSSGVTKGFAPVEKLATEQLAKLAPKAVASAAGQVAVLHQPTESPRDGHCGSCAP